MPSDGTGSGQRAPVNVQWGGRFSTAGDDRLRDINASIHFDHKLWRQDILGSLAHARMLRAVGVLSEAEEQEIRVGLLGIRDEIERGEFGFDQGLEDIHMNIEVRLIERIGDAGRKLHTARSRNDQVATDFRLWIRDAVDEQGRAVTGLMRALAGCARTWSDAVMPGFTHMQVAQPVTFGHHLLAYVEMLDRDRGRLADCRKRLNECPLGSAALAGTRFPIDRGMTARELGFERPMRNSLDGVSDRDFALEYLGALAILMVHLSRFGEELVLWSSPVFGFVSLPEAFTTGSSIMPQKRNPDAAELVRAKSGRVFGSLLGLLTTMKGLPLAYSKDMQEDKEAVFDGAEAVSLGLAVMEGMVEGMKPDAERMAAAAALGHSTATDLADWLVVELGIPFRSAHHIVGRLVAMAEGRGGGLAELSLEEMRSVEPAITEGMFGVLGIDSSVASRRSLGGTAPELVRREAERWLAVLEREPAA